MNRLPELFFVLSFLISCSTNKDNSTIEEASVSLTDSDSVSALKDDSISALKADAVSADTMPVLGIDVSHFQQDINWEKIKQANISFAYMKATQGISYKDSKFDKNWVDSKEANLYRGAYHFYIAGEDPLLQAENFLKVVGAAELDELPPVLDLEELSVKNKIAIDAFQRDALLWLETVEKKLSIKPIIYTDPSFANKYLDHQSFAKYNLWVAEYGVHKPKLPKVWKEIGWTIWQRTDRGKIEGAIGDVDHDLFNANKEALVKLANNKPL